MTSEDHPDIEGSIPEAPARLSSRGYVYVVRSRRSGGVSIGLNLSPTRICNWRCVYCQVPGLARGESAPIDVPRFEAQLGETLDAEIVHAAEHDVHDIAIAGQGEPTLSRDLLGAMEALRRVLAARDLDGRLPVCLITNGSMMEKSSVRESLRILAALGGEVWFKLDEIGVANTALMNGSPQSEAAVMRRLRIAAEACPVRLQRMMLETDAASRSNSGDAKWIAFVGHALSLGIPLAGVSVYGLARESQQPEADRLRRLPEASLERFASRVRALGLSTEVHA